MTPASVAGKLVPCQGVPVQTTKLPLTPTKPRPMLTRPQRMPTRMPPTATESTRNTIRRWHTGNNREPTIGLPSVG